MWAVGALLVLFSACGEPTSPNADSGRPSGGGDGGALNGAVRNPKLQVGTVSLPEVTVGRPSSVFTMKAEPGGLLVVYFGYTSCPDLCPTTLAALRRVYSALGDDAARIDTAMVTVDPFHDTPDVLSQYLGSFLVRYRALRTEDNEALQAAQEPFAASSSIMWRSYGTKEVSHVASVYVVDAKGTVLVEWPFGLGPKEMEHDLRVLLAARA